ncbi:MAG: hypothetical protein ACLFVJ_13535 [Persicimonas sp.]
MSERHPDDHTPQPANKGAPKGGSGGGLGAVVLHHTVTAVMLALIIALGVWAYLTFRSTSFFQPPDAKVDSRVESYALEAQLQRIHFALGVYFRLDGRYPADLAEVVERGLLLRSDLYYPSGRERLAYGRTASGYTLELAPTK